MKMALQGKALSPNFLPGFGKRKSNEERLCLKML